MRRITASAPLRACDLGGWTDTWFAGHGVVVNLAVVPRVEVEVVVRSRSAQPAHLIHARSYGETYAVDPFVSGPHPLLEQAIAEMALPDELTVELSVSSGVPPGASMGTSAAVVVAIVAALDAVVGGGRSPVDIAETALRVETQRLGWQSGIQDQHASAQGGATLIEMSAYPQAVVTPLALSEPTWAELDERLLLVLLDRPHVSSSAVHQAVIADFERGRGEHHLEVLRACARVGADALLAGDLAAFGAVMSDNTEAQSLLHPGLVNQQARAVIEIARRAGALGWKVNGAGGDGGSLTVLAGSAGRVPIVHALDLVAAPVTAIPTTVSRRGVTVTG